MADNNLPTSPGPVDTTPQSQDALIEDISNLLEDPETDLPEPEEKAKAEDDPLLMDDASEDVETDETPEPDGPEEPEIKGGRFAPDTAKVTLDDGTVITVAELKRNNLYQRGFTEKTTALAREREAFEAERQTVTEQSQSLARDKELVSWFAQNYLPKAPVPPTDPQDFVGWHEYRLAKDSFDYVQQVLGSFDQTRQQETAKQAEARQKQAQQKATEEFTKLTEKIPALKDTQKRMEFFTATITGAQKAYGFSEQEIRGIEDHRMVLALRDALAYRRLQQKAPDASKQVRAKPAIAQPGRRALPTTVENQARQRRTEELRKTGSFEAGVASLMDFDL